MKVIVLVGLIVVFLMIRQDSKTQKGGYRRSGGDRQSGGGGRKYYWYNYPRKGHPYYPDLKHPTFKYPANIYETKKFYPFSPPDII